MVVYGPAAQRTHLRTDFFSFCIFTMQLEKNCSTWSKFATTNSTKNWVCVCIKALDSILNTATMLKGCWTDWWLSLCPFQKKYSKNSSVVQYFNILLMNPNRSDESPNILWKKQSTLNIFLYLTLKEFIFSVTYLHPSSDRRILCRHCGYEKKREEKSKRTIVQA